jgi:hypothetical protein
MGANAVGSYHTFVTFSYCFFTDNTAFLYNLSKVHLAIVTVPDTADKELELLYVRSGGYAGACSESRESKQLLSLRACSSLELL